MEHGDRERRPSKKPKFSNQDDGEDNRDSNRPLWVCPDGPVFLEPSSACYERAQDFLIAIAEPVSRTELIHEYNLTHESLCSAASSGLKTETIISVLNKLSQTKLEKQLIDFIQTSTANCSKAKLVLKNNRYFVEPRVPEVLNILLKDRLTFGAKISSITNNDREFEIDPRKVRDVMKRCLQDGLNDPMVEEYDYRNDHVNPNVVGMQINPQAHEALRPYQIKSLSTMFGNGRARSGIIVLPCDAGKSLVGVSAACTIGKSCLCLTTNVFSVDQWVYQFKLWSTIRDEQICRFKSDYMEEASEVLIRRKSNAAGVVVVTTYNMLGFGGNRSLESRRIIEEIRNREWGLILMDEVHVTPAASFRNVIQFTKSHCKLGLTATLLREDEKTTDLNLLIGPKLYEANWLDLAKRRYIAKVSCFELRCEMTEEFSAEYKKDNKSQRLVALQAMNPNKFRTYECLIKFHEDCQGDKIIVLSDNLFALKEYAKKLVKPIIHGATTPNETARVLEKFKTNPKGSTLFMSKVGEIALDIPEANVIIEISWHGGSRRQETQRLDRMLRPKKSQDNAFFYSLMSSGTRKVEFAAKRLQHLVAQGYNYEVLKKSNFLGLGLGAWSYDNLEDQRAHDNLEDQRALLKKVLGAEDDTVGAKVPPEQDASGKGQVKRNVTDLAFRLPHALHAALPTPGSQSYPPRQLLVSPCLGLVRGSAPDPDQFV